MISICIVYDKSLSSDDKRNNGVAASKTFRGALAQFVQSSNASNDYCLIRVAQKPQPLVDWTSDHDALLSKLENVETERESALYDAFFMALEKLRTSKHQKRILLVVSDGSDNRSKVDYPELLDLLLSGDTVVYAIATQDAHTFRNPYTPGSITETVFLDSVTDITGGVTYVPRNKRDLIEIVELMATELRQQYRISIKSVPSKDDTKLQELKVKLSPSSTLPRELRQKLTLRSRNAY